MAPTPPAVQAAADRTATATEPVRGAVGLPPGVAALIALDGRGGSRDCHAQTQDERENKGYKLSHCDFSFSVKM